MHTDEFYMRQALTIAQYAIGRTTPNPMVGSVIVKNGEVVGHGWHRQAGTPHAEIHALNQAGELAAGATLYVTLEPCCHYGRTGPCTEAIIKSGIKKVVIAMTDPNKLVAGCGVTALRTAGIEVVEGVLACEAAKVNESFIKWISTKMPFGVLKTAMTLDGKIAAHTGHSKWITGENARQRVHQIRNQCDAILVGIGTVLADNPQLTTRLPEGGNNPIRIVVDTSASIPLNSQVLIDGQAPTIVAVAEDALDNKVADLEKLNIEVIRVPRAERGINLRKLFEKLGSKGITSILIEGGASINASAFQENLVDKVYWFIAPKIIGGYTAPGPVGGKGLELVSNADLLEDVTTEFIGEDILINAYVRQREARDVYRSCGRIG